ncbi:hypothetical protein LOAG_11141 [Loa loa]|uniref:Uncharacterized protein n=1 Tax=Loa loa TaxID=7209 RepID=A0A1S0TNL4_LOALO|nr:hypothetical protein LOAG_11141 [Loa loa]EFO17357.1 hypothetical protein LOAG_11141 [Loa loa]
MSGHFCFTTVFVDSEKSLWFSLVSSIVSVPVVVAQFGAMLNEFRHRDVNFLLLRFRTKLERVKNCDKTGNTTNIIFYILPRSLTNTDNMVAYHDLRNLFINLRIFSNVQ